MWAACRSGADADKAHSAATPSKAAQATEPKTPPLPLRPLWRVVERAGSQELQEIAGFGQCALSGADGVVALDLQGGARVRLDPASAVCALSTRPSTLFVLRGGVFAQLLAQANPEGRPELRIVIAPGSLTLSAGAELWVGQRNWIASSNASEDAPEEAAEDLESQAYLAMLRGYAQLARFEADAEARPEGAAPKPRAEASSSASAKGELAPKLQPLTAPDELGFGLKLRPRSPRTLDAARASGQALLQKRATPLRISGSEHAVESLLARAGEEEQQRAALLRRLPKPGSPESALPADDVRSYQRELAEHAQQAHGLREAVRLASEHTLLATLGLCVEHTAAAAFMPAHPTSATPATPAASTAPASPATSTTPAAAAPGAPAAPASPTSPAAASQPSASIAECAGLARWREQFELRVSSALREH